MNDCVIINGEVLMNNSDKDVEKEKVTEKKDNIKNEKSCNVCRQIFVL